MNTLKRISGGCFLFAIIMLIALISILKVHLGFFTELIIAVGWIFVAGAAASYKIMVHD